MSRARRLTGRTLAPLVGWALLAACGTGSEVDMGRVTVSRAPAGPPAVDSCGARPCTVHVGSRVFVEGDATEADVDALAGAVSQPSGSDASHEPVLLYPANETLLPVNLALVRFAWTAPASTLFALDFSGPNTNVRIVTDATSFSASEEEWQWIAESNAAGRVNLAVLALDPNDASHAWASNPVELDFSAAPLNGTIYYWSTGARGLMQARIDDAVPVRVYSDPAGPDAGTCTGCHTVSRDGTRVAFSTDKPELAEASLPGRMQILPSVTGTADPMAPKDPKGMMSMPAPTPTPIPASFSTFSPDGTLLLTAAHGKLHLVSADTGMALGDPTEVALPMGTLATHPDWSPDGARVAVTLATKGGDKQTEGGSIALLPYDGSGSFGDPDVIVPNQGGSDNNYFPSFSPDGRFIAYVNASGPSEDAPSARIRLVDVQSRAIIELPRLNQRVGADDGLLNLGNSMPTWAPSAPSNGGTYWLAFSSLRAYADLRPADLKKDQLFIAGIDPTLPDPSFAAFWAPFQNIDQGNHRAFWAPDAPLAQCGDTCADREICGDGLDNDCDCVVDDCSQEICNNGVDDDGDGRIDQADPACPATMP